MMTASQKAIRTWVKNCAGRSILTSVTAKGFNAGRPISASRSLSHLYTKKSSVRGASTTPSKTISLHRKNTTMRTIRTAKLRKITFRSSSRCSQNVISPATSPTASSLPPWQSPSSNQKRH